MPENPLKFNSKGIQWLGIWGARCYCHGSLRWIVWIARGPLSCHPFVFLRWRRRVLHTFRLAFVFMRTFHVARYVLDWSLSPAACSPSPLPFCPTYISFKACENIEVAPKITIAYIIRSIFEHVGWGIRNGDFGDWWQLSDKSACRARKHKHKYK